MTSGTSLKRNCKTNEFYKNKKGQAKMLVLFFNGIKRLVTAFPSWLDTLSSQVKTRLQTAKERL